MMPEWEDAPAPIQVNNNNIKNFAGIVDKDLNANFLVDDNTEATVNNNLATIDAELARPSLHPVARKALLEERNTLAQKTNFLPSKGTKSTDDGWETAPSASGWEDAPSKTSYLEDIKSGLAQVGNMADKGITLAASLLAPKSQEQGMFQGMDQREKQRLQWANPEGKEQSFGGKVVSAASSLPMQVLAAPLGAIDTAVKFIKNGESLDKAYTAAGIDAAFTAAGFVIPAAVGKTLITKALSGGASNAMLEYLNKLSVSSLADKKETKANFEPTLEDAGVAGITGAGIGAMLPHSKNVENGAIESANKINAALNPEKVAPTIETPTSFADVMKQSDAENTRLDLEKLKQQLESKETLQQQYDQQVQTKQQMFEQARNEQAGELSDYSKTENPNQGQLNFGLSADEGGTSLRNRPDISEFVKDPLEYDPSRQGELNTPPQLEIPELSRGEKGDALTSSDADTASRALKEWQASQLNWKDDLQFKLDKERQEQLPLDYMQMKDMGDKTLMSDDHTKTMVDSLRVGDLGGALRTIAENHSDVGYRKLATYLQDKIGEIGVAVHDHSVIKAGERDITGYFDPTKNVIGLSGLGSVSPHTVLHETIHALTSQFLHTKPTSILSVGMKNLFTTLRDRPGFGKFSGIINEREFLAEAFSNPEFQSFLKKQQVETTGPVKSAWGRFVGVVKRIAGITDQKTSNAFDHAIDLGKQIVEQSNETFRDNAREQLKDAGVPSKLIDLMAQHDPENARTPETGPDSSRIEALKNMSWAARALEDFIPEKFSMDQIREYAKDQPDVEQNFLQKAFNDLTSGGLYQSLKTKNIVVKKTYEVMSNASDKATGLINNYIKDSEHGLLPAMRDLSLKEKADVVALRVIADAEQKPLNPLDAARAGFNEKQIAYLQTVKHTMDAALNSINEARIASGKKVLDARLGYAVSKMTGDFRRGVFKDSETQFDKDGKPVKEFIGQIGANTRMGLNKLMAQVSDAHPEWHVGEEKFLGKGAHRDNNGTRQAAYRDAVQFLQDNSKSAEDLVKVLHDSFLGDAYDFMNAKKHTLAKKGAFGYEGRKAWESAQKNALDFMHGEVAYAETMFKWGELTKGVKELTPLLADEDIKMPNAKAWADRYIDQTMGINPSQLGKAFDKVLGSISEMSGIGSTPIQHTLRFTKAVTNTVLLSLNHMYLAVNAIQPFQGMPVIKNFLESRGLHNLSVDFGTGYKYLFDGALSSMKDLTNGKIGGQMSPFEKRMVQYGSDHHIFGNEVLDSSSLIHKNAGYYAEKVSSFGINSIESGTNRMVFSAVSHMLKDAGMTEKEGIFETAFKLTKVVMHDYRPQEAPALFNHFGPLGSMAKNLTKYRSGQASQMALMAREIPNNASFRPLAAFMTTQIAFSGLLGVMGFQEADQLVQFLSKKFGKPTTLAKIVLDHVPELVSHGIGSLVGVDLTQRLGNPSLLPDTVGQFLFGGGSKIADIASAGYNAVTSPSEMNTKRAIREISPQTFTGPMDRSWFSTTDKDGNEMGVTRKDSKAHNIEAQVVRNDSDKLWKTLGATGVHEAKEKAIKYNNDLVASNYTELRKNVISDLADQIFTKGNLDKQDAREAFAKYLKYQGDPNTFVNDVQKELMAQKLSAQKRDILKNSGENVTKINNLKRIFGKE